MKKLSVIAKSVVITMSMVSLAHAQDLLKNNWTGYYAGANAGVIFNDVKIKSQHLGFTDPDGKCNTSSDFASFFPGAQLGYRYQYRNYLVTGIEANITVNTNQKETLDCICPINPGVSDSFVFENKMQGAIKGIMGRAVSWNKRMLLPYLTAGVSLADLELSYNNEGGDHYSHSSAEAGLLVGAGIEWAFMQNWSLRAEYSYIYYGNAIDLNIPSVYGLDDTNGNAHADLNVNNLAVAVNYWF